MDALTYVLKARPELALFAAQASGHAWGRLKLGSFRLGFEVTYAVSNVLLAMWGPVIVAFT
jgi:hypothetical protein